MNQLSYIGCFDITCGDPPRIEEVIKTDIKPLLGEFTIYPNPTTGLVNVFLQLPDSSKNEQVVIRIIDILGRELFVKNISTNNSNILQTTLDMQSFPTGTYIINAITNDKSYNKIMIKN